MQNQKKIENAQTTSPKHLNEKVLKQNVDEKTLDKPNQKSKENAQQKHVDQEIKPNLEKENDQEIKQQDDQQNLENNQDNEIEKEDIQDSTKDKESANNEASLENEKESDLKEETELNEETEKTNQTETTEDKKQSKNSSISKVNSFIYFNDTNYENIDWTINSPGNHTIKTNVTISNDIEKAVVEMYIPIHLDINSFDNEENGHYQEIIEKSATTKVEVDQDNQEVEGGKEYTHHKITIYFTKDAQTMSGGTVILNVNVSADRKKFLLEEDVVMHSKLFSCQENAKKVDKSLCEEKAKDQMQMKMLNPAYLRLNLDLSMKNVVKGQVIELYYNAYHPTSGMDPLTEDEVIHIYVPDIIDLVDKDDPNFTIKKDPTPNSQFNIITIKGPTTKGTIGKHKLAVKIASDAKAATYNANTLSYIEYLMSNRERVKIDPVAFPRFVVSDKEVNLIDQIMQQGYILGSSINYEDQQLLMYRFRNDNGQALENTNIDFNVPDGMKVKALRVNSFERFNQDINVKVITQNNLEKNFKIEHEALVKCHYNNGRVYDPCLINNKKLGLAENQHYKKITLELGEVNALAQSYFTSDPYRYYNNIQIFGDISNEYYNKSGVINSGDNFKWEVDFNFDENENKRATKKLSIPGTFTHENLVNVALEAHKVKRSGNAWVMDKDEILKTNQPFTIQYQAFMSDYKYVTQSKGVSQIVNPTFTIRIPDGFTFDLEHFKSESMNTFNIRNGKTLKPLITQKTLENDQGTVINITYYGQEGSDTYLKLKGYDKDFAYAGKNTTGLHFNLEVTVGALAKMGGHDFLVDHLTWSMSRNQSNNQTLINTHSPQIRQDTLDLNRNGLTSDEIMNWNGTATNTLKSLTLNYADLFLVNTGSKTREDSNWKTFVDGDAQKDLTSSKFMNGTIGEYRAVMFNGSQGGTRNGTMYIDVPRTTTKLLNDKARVSDWNAVLHGEPFVSLDKKGKDTKVDVYYSTQINPDKNELYKDNPQYPNPEKVEDDPTHYLSFKDLMASANIDYTKCQSTMEKDCQKVLDKVTTIKINATGIDYQTVLTFNAEFAVEKEFSKDDIDKFAFVHSQVKADNSQNNGYIFHPGIGAFKYTASELSGMVFEDTGYNSIYENSDNLLNEIPLYLFDAKEFNDYLSKNNITKVSDQDIEKITSNKELKVLASTTSNAAGEYRFLIPTLSETNSDVYADKYVIFAGKSDKYLIANLQSDDQNDNANKFDPNTRATAAIAKSTSKNDKFHLGLGLDVVVKETQDYHFKALNSQDITFSDKNIAMYDLNQLFDNGNLIEPLNLSTYLKNKGNDDDQSNNTDLLCSDYIKYQRYMQSTQVKLNGLQVTPENTYCKLSAKVKDKYNQGTKDISVRLTTFVNNSSITGELYLEDKTVEQLVSTGGEYIQDYTIKVCRDFDEHCEYGEIKRNSENNVTYTIDNLVFIPNTTYHFEVLNKEGNLTRLVRVISSLMANGTSVTSQDQGQSIKYDFDIDNDAMNVDVDIYVTEEDLPTASIKPHYNAIDQSDLEEVVREDYKVNPSSFDFEAIDATTSATAQCLISDEKNIPSKEEIWAEKKIGVPSKHDNDPSNVKHEEFINYDYDANGSRKERITCVARDIVNNTSDLVSQAYDVDVDAPQVEVEITKSAKFTNPQNIKVKIQDNLDKEPKYKYSILKYDAMSGEYFALPNGKGSGYGPVDPQGNRIPGNQDKEDYLNEITIPSEAYSNLENGKYRFKVEAMDYAGNSSITPENEWDYPGQVDFEVGKTLKGTVFKDANYDSRRNSLSSNIIMPIFNQFFEEQGIPNIVVELYKSDKKTLLASTKTNSKGQYEFDLHTVEEEKNANYEKDYYYLKIDANYNGSIQTHDNASLKAYIIGNIQKAQFSPNNNAFDFEAGEFKDSYYAKVKIDSENLFTDNFVGVDAAFGLRPSVSDSKQDEYVNKEFSLALNNLVNAQVDKNQKIIFKDKDNQVVEDDIIKCLVDQNKEQLSKTTCQASLVNEYHSELLINDIYSLNPDDEQVNRPTYKHQVKVNINELKHFSGNLQFVANDQDKNVISHTTELLEKLPLEALSLEIVSSDNQTYTANIEINNEQKIISYNFNDDITNPGDYKLRLKLDESSKAYQDGFRILNQNNELTSLHEIDLSFDNSSRTQVLVNNFRISDGLKPEISLEQNGGTIVNNRLYNPK